jgi:hypothetical protein
MRLRRFTGRLAAALAISLLAAPADARGVDLQLVLAIDVSSSVDHAEYVLQVAGVAAAFRSAEVGDAIARAAPNGIAVTVLQWASEGEQRQAVAWTRLAEDGDRLALAARIEAMPRIGIWGVTALGDALDVARGLFGTGGFVGGRQVIDVSGDGVANQGMPVAAARQRAVAAGITVNALAVLNEEPALEAYYLTQVIGGPGAFVMTAADYADFAAAIRIKLVREIIGAGLASDPAVGWKVAAVR